MEKPKRTEYTKMITYLWSIMKLWKTSDPARAVELETTRLLNLSTDPKTKDQYTVQSIYKSVYTLFLERRFLTGKTPSLFLPSVEFAEWIVSCVEGHYEEYATELFRILNPKGQSLFCDVALHFPKGEGKGSVLVSLEKTIQTELVDAESLYKILRDPSFAEKNTMTSDVCQVIVVHPSVVGTLVCGFSSWLTDLDKPKVQSTSSSWYMRLTLGLGLYLSCFPETLQQGPPENMQDASWYKRLPCFNVKVDDRVRSVAGEHTSIRTPHFRNAHFRLLRSEKFTHKRGKIILVPRCWVKGKALTVLD